MGGSSWNRPQKPNPGHLRDCWGWGCLGRFLGNHAQPFCEEINPREKPQNGTQENPEKPNRRRKAESPSRRESPTKKGCFTRPTIIYSQTIIYSHKVIDDKGSFCDPSTSSSTSPKTSVSLVTSSLTNRVSLLSLSDKPTVDMIGTTDYATGSFCSSCSIQPTLPGRFWLDGMGCAMCSYDYGSGG